MKYLLFALPIFLAFYLFWFYLFEAASLMKDREQRAECAKSALWVSLALTSGIIGLFLIVGK